MLRSLTGIHVFACSGSLMSIIKDIPIVTYWEMRSLLVLLHCIQTGHNELAFMWLET